MTPRELIEMLERWDQDRPFEVASLNPTPESFVVEREYSGVGGPSGAIVLRQGLNSINLTGKD